MTPGTERQIAAAHWLLSAAPSVPQVSAEWRNQGASWLRLGSVFGAVHIPAALVEVAIGEDGPQACADGLAVALAGGPVYYSRQGSGLSGGYTALLPAEDALLWGMRGTTAYPPRAQLFVPAPHQVEPRDDGPWWVVPLDGPGLLCRPGLLAKLVGVGRGRLRLPGGTSAA